MPLHCLQLSGTPEALTLQTQYVMLCLQFRSLHDSKLDVTTMAIFHLLSEVSKTSLAGEINELS